MSRKGIRPEIWLLVALVLLIGLAVAAKWWWWQVPPVIAITAPAGQFTKVEMWEEGISESGEPRSLANGRAEYPAEYGRHFVKVTLADQRACTFLYAHSDAGVRRKVTIHLEQLAKDRCRAQIWFNGFGQGSVEFDPALTADHPVILPPHH